MQTRFEFQADESCDTALTAYTEAQLMVLGSRVFVRVMETWVAAAVFWGDRGTI